MSTGRSFHHRFFALVLAIGIVALLTSTGALVVNSLSQKSTSNVSTSIPSNRNPLDIGSVLASYIKHKGKLPKGQVDKLLRPYITFIGNTLSPSENRLTGTLEVIIPPGIPPQLKNHSTSLFQQDSAGNFVVKPQFANAQINAAVMVTNAGGNFEQHEFIKLKDLYTTSVLGLHEYPIDIPVKGSSGRYPQDSYTGDISMFLNFPGTQQFTSGKNRQVQSIEAGTLSNTYAISAKRSPATYQKILSNVNDTFFVSLTRQWYNQFFVYTVALIPVLFAIIFLHLLFFAGGGHGIGRSFEHFTEALVVSVLSVLPLRVVLVPGDISGLTRVDLTLAVGLVLIVAVAAGKYSGEIWGGRETVPEVEAEHEEVARDEGLSEAEANATV